MCVCNQAGSIRAGRDVHWTQTTETVCALAYRHSNSNRLVVLLPRPESQAQLATTLPAQPGLLYEGGTRSWPALRLIKEMHLFALKRKLAHVRAHTHTYTHMHGYTHVYTQMHTHAIHRHTHTRICIRTETLRTHMIHTSLLMFG